MEKNRLTLSVPFGVGDIKGADSTLDGTFTITISGKQDGKGVHL